MLPPRSYLYSMRTFCPCTATISFFIFICTTRRIETMNRKIIFAAAGLALSAMLPVAWAEEKPSGHPGTPETEMRYKGAPVLIKPEEVPTPEGPPLSASEFNRAKLIYFERCAGCHGVLSPGGTRQAPGPADPPRAE